MGRSYTTGTDHGEVLSAALNAFYDALVRRWREEAGRAATTGQDVVATLSRPDSPLSATAIWDYTSGDNYRHVSDTDARTGGWKCKFVDWALGGQEGELSSVTCDGMLHPDDRPPSIDCGMGSIMAAVEDWSWGERDHLSSKLPWFGHHDLGAIQQAHDAFIRAGQFLSLVPGDDSDTGGLPGSFDGVEDRNIPSIVDSIGTEAGEGRDWWAGWTGLAAARAKSGFFASVQPTMRNQSSILGCLANLYAFRAAIIESGRTTTLNLLQRATSALGERGTTDLSTPLTVVKGAGTIISAVGAWTGVGGGVGATIGLVGFIGDQLIGEDGEVESLEFANDLEDTVSKLNNQIDDLNGKIDLNETSFWQGVSNLRDSIHGLHSYNLELYDFTQNNATGDARDEGNFLANVDDILRIAESCYDAGERYPEVLSRIAESAAADEHLADKDNQQTNADRNLLEVRDRLEQFVKTTSSRYLMAGDQVKSAAQAYAQQDSDQRGAFDRTMSDWADEGVGDYNVDFDVGSSVDETGRGDFGRQRPYHYGPDGPVGDGGVPGYDDDSDYVTE